jgi:beta-galactosidase
MNDAQPRLILFATIVFCWPVLATANERQVRSLDGRWEIVFDHQDQGKFAGWHQNAAFSKRADIRIIEVPSCWELTEKDYEGVAFYRRTFQVPPDWRDKVVRVQFDAVNFKSEVWLNDQPLGTHEGGFTPFTFRVDPFLRFDDVNILTLRVVGPILLQDKTIDGMGPMETPQWRGAIAGGIWQPVRLLATGATYAKDVFIEPNILENTATFHLQLDHTHDQATTTTVGIVIRSDAKIVANGSQVLNLKPGVSHHALPLKIPNPNYWSPDHPHLYRAEITVGQSDRWVARFGMREFTIRNKQWMLNGQPFQLKATFFEGLYPLKLAYPDSREMASREIQFAKDAGFNMIRPWRKPPPPMWLDLADEMGVLIVGSLAIECMDFPRKSPRLQAWVENEVRESILRDRSRTCVVQWELFNELKRPVLKEMLDPMVKLARELDPTRLILDESGGWAFGANMYLPYSREPTKFNDIHDYPGQKINDEVYTKLLLAGSVTHDEMRLRGLRGRLPGRNVVPGLMTFFSELGYGSLPDLVDNNKRFAELGNPIAPPTVYHRRLADQHRQALTESGFDTIYPDLQQFCLDQQFLHGTANRRMIESVRCNPHVKGYCIHALTAGDWIMGAGLLDLFRNPKTFVYEATKAANRPRIISIRVRPRNVYADRGATIEVTGVNDLEAIAARLQVDVINGSGQVVFSSSTDVDLASGIQPIFCHNLATNTLQGTHTVQAKVVSKDGETIADNAYNFDVFASNQRVPTDQSIAVLDPSNSLKPFLKKSGMVFEEFNAQTKLSIPVLVSRTEASSPEERRLFGALEKFVKSGGTAVYLQGGGTRVSWGKSSSASPLLPFSARQKNAVGNWSCIPRLVKAHPIFEGLPVNCMMGPVYENVWPQSTLQDFEGETIAASVGFDWFPEYDLSKRHYYGPGDAWWGADVAIVHCGMGRCIASQLRIIENLGVDPVADQIFLNLVDWTAAQARHHVETSAGQK